jgi:hypothetical protein
MRCGACRRSIGKTHHHLPDGIGLVRGNTPGSGAGHETVVEIGQLALPVLFGDDFAQAVGLGIGKPGQGLGRPGDILLVDHDAEGLVEHVGQQRVDGIPAAAVQAPQVLLDIDVGRRADDGGVNDQMIEVAAAGFLVQQSHGRALDVKAAHGEAPGHGIPGGGIVLGLPSVFIEK